MNRDILISTVSKRYAHALLAVAVRRRSFSLVLEELEQVRNHLLDFPVLQKLFLNPALPQEIKERILEQIASKLNLQELTRNFLRTLIRRDRLNLLEQIIVSAEQQFLEQQGILVVEVTSARRLDPDHEKKLVEKLESFTGRKIQVENRLDPALIGGAVTRIGTTLYDGSVQAQLEQMKIRIEEEE